MNVSGTIRDILETKPATVHSVDPSATVYQAIKLMAEKNVGALVVMNGYWLKGVISERDYTRKVILRGKSSKTTPVADIMTRTPVTTTLDRPVDECLKLMTENRVRHLPVKDGRKVVGIVSIGDLVKWVISTQDATIVQLESYIAGGY